MNHSIAFSKLEALGNDFILIDARAVEFAPERDQVRKLADRRLGIGCDQLLILTPDDSGQALARIMIFNSDGSRAEQCGNGMRAIARWLEQRGELLQVGQVITDAGPVGLTLLADHQVQATLPPPDLSALPGAPASPDGTWQEQLHGFRLVMDYLSLGNPHLIALGEDPLLTDQLGLLGPELERHPALTTGANVSLARITGPAQVDLVVHERGAGPTPACGSGACATAVALIRRGRISPPVRVSQPGGTLVIDWRGEGSPIIMTGPARHVFDGRIDLEAIHPT